MTLRNGVIANVTRHALFAMLAFGGISACGEDQATEPSNHSPSIRSFTATPDSLGQADTALVVCDVLDPDGDTLYFDWIIDGATRIQGAPGHVYLFSSRSNSQRLDISPLASATDTGWVYCTVRDNHGGADNGRLFILLNR